MEDNHVLNLNPHKTMRCLAGILTPAEISKIQDEINANAIQLMRLADAHLRFAKSASGQLSWRQRVSRGYYSCYSASKAVRLAVQGTYDTDVKDHKQIGDLPAGFPNRQTWKDLLTKFRADRNIADYDHSETENALELPSTQYLDEATAFIAEAKAFLRDRGVL
ncbi:hypothetical protein [Novipirellula maiorica]|nr:hypothetical protein [Rhodopirellula maiorica]